MKRVSVNSSVLGDMSLRGKIPIKNKKDEPEFKLKLDPPGRIVFRSDDMKHEVITTIKLKNTSNQLQCYKVKTTSNLFFRVRPPLGILRPKEVRIINFCFKYEYIPDCEKHVFVIYHVSTNQTTNPTGIWENSKPDGVRRMACFFEKNDGTTWACTEPSTSKK